MDTRTLSFTDRLRRSLVGDDDVRFVFLGNFEVEEHWAAPYGRLPGFAVKSSAAVVNRMEEFALSLATPADYVLLKDKVDPHYAAYLAERGLGGARVLHVDENRPESTVTEDALRSPLLIKRLRSLAAGRNTHLLPVGVSHLEERLAAVTGLPLAVPRAVVFKRVNSKIYSRALGERLGLRSIPGQAVSDVAELRRLDRALLGALDRGERLVVKEALGVSGKGLVRVDSSRRLEQLTGLLDRRAQRSGDTRLDLVVETWIDKRCDLNYQFVVARDGTVTFDFVKEAVTEAGVHKGHRMPARLTDAQVEELRDCAERIGARLYGDGYHGVVGVDAILDVDETLYPLLEINARFNMSTFQTDVADRWIGPDKVAVARQYPVRLERPLCFEELSARLGPAMFDPESGSGFLVNNFGALNAARTNGAAFDGRLYGLLIADSDGSLADLERKLDERLHTIDRKGRA